MSNDSSPSQNEGEARQYEHNSARIQYSNESPYEYEIAVEAEGSLMGASAVAGAAVARGSPEATVVDASGWQEDGSCIVYVYVEYDEKPDVSELWESIDDSKYSVCEINRLGEIVDGNQ